MTQFSEATSPGNTPHSTAVVEDDPRDAALLDSLLSGGPAPSSSASDSQAGGRPIRRTVHRAVKTDAMPVASNALAAVALGADERIQLIHGCQGIVRSLAWKIHRKLPGTIDLDDLIAYGQVGLAQAARDFDPGFGGKFTTYAYWRVRGAILDGLSQMSWFKRQDFHASKYEVRRHEATGQDSDPAPAMKDESAIPATAGPVHGEEIGIPDLADAPRPLTMTSIGAESSGDADSRGAGSVADLSTRTPPTQSMMREMMEHVRKSIEKLPPEAATLIRAAYFEGVTLHEAGRRLGISRAWTSRLHARALEKLARDLRSHWS